MLVRICTKIADQLIRADILEYELEAWCIYWLQKRILTALGISMMLLFGGLHFGVGITICFLLGVLPLRRHLSGYHTQSPFTCMALFLGIMIAALLLHSLFNFTLSVLFSIANSIACLVFITKIPVSEFDPRVHIGEEEIEANHRLAFYTLILEDIVGGSVALLLRSIEYLSACQIGIFVAVASSAYRKFRRLPEQAHSLSQNSRALP